MCVSLGFFIEICQHYRGSIQVIMPFAKVINLHGGVEGTEIQFLVLNKLIVLGMLTKLVRFAFGIRTIFYPYILISII
jgi:hypothetical protein